jgi:peptidoglycan/LPS O-acetylase OafA/YrhL
LIRIRVSWGVKLTAAFILSFVLILAKGGNELFSFIHQRNLNYSGAYWQFGDLLTWIVGLPVWLLGVCLADQVGSYKKAPSAPWTWAFRLAALCAGIVFDVLKFHFFVSYIFSMNIFALFLFFWLRNEIVYYRHRQPAALLEYSGKFSYSLYLCHNVSAHFITMILPLTLYSYLPIVALTIFSAYLFYLVVERPSHLLSRKLALWTNGRRVAINY